MNALAMQSLSWATVFTISFIVMRIILIMIFPRFRGKGSKDDAIKGTILFGLILFPVMGITYYLLSYSF